MLQRVGPLRFGKLGLLTAVSAVLAALTTPTLAAQGNASQASETLMLAQVVVLVIFGRILGEILFRLGQPSIVGQILAGIILGPSVLGLILPQVETALFPVAGEQAAMLNGISQLGILFLLLLAGMETDLSLAYRLRRKAVTVSLSGIAVPFVCGFGLGLLLPEALLPDPNKRLVAALFLGTALSISSLKIVATVVREMNFMRRNVGQLIVASAVIDDTVGWVIIAITLGIATTGSVAFAPLAVTVLGTAIFLALAFTIGRRAAFELIRWTNDNLHSDLPVTTAIIGLMGVLALITAGLGIQTVLGAFIAGLLIGQSPILTRQIDEQLRGLTTALFMPVFFGLTGLHTDLRVLLDPLTALLAVGLILVASLGKFGGAFLGAELSGLNRREALAMAFGMNARGSTEVIVASIGLSVGVLDQRLFSVIVTMAIVTTLIMPPTLRWALARLPLSAEEKQRLERETFEDEDSFLSGHERILLVVDPSPNGRLASALSGYLAGLRNMPVTVLELLADDPPANAKPKPLDQVKVASKEAIAIAQEADETRGDTIHVEARLEPGDLEKSIAAEVEKGHDLLFLGIKPLTAERGGYDNRAKTALDSFKHSVILVTARGALNRNPETALRILVPVTGDQRSMRAVELASIIAKANGASVTAIYVQVGDDVTERPRATMRDIFERVQEIGENYGTRIKTISSDSGNRELAILTHARRGRYNLVLLGVARRAGEALSFGSLADTLLETSDRSLAFFVTS